MKILFYLGFVVCILGLFVFNNVPLMIIGGLMTSIYVIHWGISDIRNQMKK